MRVAITGGSGSLGRALIRRLIVDGADRIVTFTRDEQKRAALRQEFGGHPGFRVYAGDVRDVWRLEDIFSGCEAVVHAAARKVVTAHPDEPEELLKTNVVGTQNVIQAAKHAGIAKVVLVSSDKAVAPENVYGVSKAMAEHLAVMANARTFSFGMRVGVVRYGNVLGSTGSVLTVWGREAAAGQPLTLSDARMTRFWFTLDGAVDLVLTALANLRGGEVVVPHLGAAPIMRLAEAVWDIAGGEGPPTFRETGIRQGGEKLHEQLVSDSEMLRAVKRSGPRGPYYVIPPFQNDETWDGAPWPGKPMDGCVRYRSDVWPWQLTAEDLRGMIL